MLGISRTDFSFLFSFFLKSPTDLDLNAVLNACLPSIKRCRKEEHKFKVRLGSTVRQSQENKTKQKTRQCRTANPYNPRN